jgi:hypothetical protein
MKQLEDTGILQKINELLSNSNIETESKEPMMQMKICIKASEKISGVIDRLQRFVANTAFPLFPDLESLVYSKEQFIRCLDRMVNCVNPDTLNLGKGNA